MESPSSTQISWFRAEETGYYGRFHLHALLHGTAALNAEDYERQWAQTSGNAVILPYDKSLGGAYYCSKYLGFAFNDYEISDVPWRRNA
jgi:hypothetical protein